MTSRAETTAQRQLGDDTYDMLAESGADMNDADVQKLSVSALPSSTKTDRDSWTSNGTVPHAQQLSRAQYEVGELIAEGFTNSQIADCLVISQRTAELHIANIMMKLEFRSRSQIAAWVNVLRHRSR